MEFQENGKMSILDIPPGWGDTAEEFKARVVQIIKYSEFWERAPKYDIVNSDGSSTPFYPILCAVSPEWWIITKREIHAILYTKYAEQALMAYRSATKSPADHIWWTVYLAWGLEQWLFSHDQIQKIRFDHGDTTESYIRENGDPHLVENAVERLIHPRSKVPEVIEKTSGYVDYCCCH